MTKPVRYDSSINFRLERALHNAFIEACGGQENVHARLRSLISQYVAKRERERGSRVKVVPLSKEGAPYGEMCRDPAICAGKGYCPRDPTCGD